MSRKKIIFILFTICILSACSRQLYMPVATDATKQAELLAGRKLYADHCSGCHNLYLPKKFTSSEWKENLDEMQPKAKITDLEKKQILVYLTSQP